MNRERVVAVLRRLRSPAINVAILCGSLGVAALVAELAVRLVAPQQLILIRPDLWQPADTVGWLHRPDVDVQINTGERTVRVITDSQGFRVGPDGPVQADHEVLVLGDSFMEALQVEYEQSGVGLVEAQLADTLGYPVALRDAGIGGWDPDQYVLRARTLLAQHKYDLVLTSIYLGNDVIPRARTYLPPRAPVQRYHFRLPRSLSWQGFTDAVLRPINDFLEVRSHLFLLFRNRLQTLRMRVGLAPLDFPTQYLISERDSGAWKVTADLCAQIADLAHQNGADALFVLIPAPFQVDSADLQHYVEGFGLDPSTIDLDQPNRKLGDGLAARGLDVIDLLPAFRAEHERGTRLYGSVDPHFSPEGNELFAREVTPVAARILTKRAASEDGAGGG